MLTRRQVLQFASIAAASASIPSAAQSPSAPGYTLDIAPYNLDLSPKHSIKTTAYNRQVPGPLLRLTEGKPVTIEVTNHTASEEIVHWHGLFLPSEVDGAMEEGTAMIRPGGQARYTFTPNPIGFRWYHTHTTANGDMKRGQYSGQHGFLQIEPRQNPAPYDAEFYLALHDWEGQFLSSGDGSMNPTYQYATINGRMLGSSDPLSVKQGQHVLFHVLNSSASEIHWLALPGHLFKVIALDGNPVPTPQSVPMLRLAPAERVCAIVEMNKPGIWILGEVRKHIQAAGMGIVVEYANSQSKPTWHQPQCLVWNYEQFAERSQSKPSENTISIPLIFESKFAGHGAPDHWLINGKSWPNTHSQNLIKGQHYRLQFINKSMDDHPVHLHRHTFELRDLPTAKNIRGIKKDVVLVPAQSQLDVEFTANNSGSTLFHCHQQNHMDEGFMLLFNYA